MENPFAKTGETKNPFAKPADDSEVVVPIIEESKVVVPPDEAKEPVLAPVVNEVEIIGLPKSEPAKQSPVMTARNEILKEHGGLESNIPINSPYWTMR